jgi:hypothetical protein
VANEGLPLPARAITASAPFPKFVIHLSTL